MRAISDCVGALDTAGTDNEQNRNITSQRQPAAHMCKRAPLEEVQIYSINTVTLNRNVLLVRAVGGLVQSCRCTLTITTSYFHGNQAALYY